MDDLLELALKKASGPGSDYADSRYGETSLIMVTCENDKIKSFEQERLVGIGIRAMVGGSMGFASTSDLSKTAVSAAAERALKLAKAARDKGDQKPMAEAKPNRAKAEVKTKEDPLQVSPEDYTKVLLEANKAAAHDRIKNRLTFIGAYVDNRRFISTDGADVRMKRTMVGLAHSSVASDSGVMETVVDMDSRCAGFEFIRAHDWNRLSAKVTSTASKAVKSKAPKAGTYHVVAGPQLVGLFMHEALGHASEGDLVRGGASVLKGKLGKKIGSPITTIVDDGAAAGGFFVPFDDEGVKKTPTTIVKDGVLNTYLTSRQTAEELGVGLSGNGRAQDFENFPIVRMTNIFLKPGDAELDEMVKDVKEGIYFSGRGGGGQVDVGGGTFSFAVGPSYMIRKGEISEMVRGTVVSGSVLDTMGGIAAVGKKLEVISGVFGGCGKDGQQAKVGLGGPDVRLEKLQVGGTA